MIISASRRTDIPAFYSEWFINRLKEGYVFVKNPRNPNRLARIALNQDVVDCIVFWSKNPAPMLDRLSEIENMNYPFYFQFTLTPYNKQVERRLPSKSECIETFKKLSDKIGSQRVVWRYDPVIIGEKYTTSYHLDSFGEMVKNLHGYTNQCIFSFMDNYPRMKNRTKGIADAEISESNMHEIANGFSEIASEYGIKLKTCAEAIHLSQYGISHASCMDKKMIEDIVVCKIHAKKDKNQREACGCIESIDIGSYDSCANGCVYCYATTNESIVKKNISMHDPNSPLLIGYEHGEQTIVNREVKSLKEKQLSLF